MVDRWSPIYDGWTEVVDRWCTIYDQWTAADRWNRWTDVDRCWNRWTDVDRWTVVGRWTNVERCLTRWSVVDRWSPIYDGWTEVVDRWCTIYDQWTAADRWNRWTDVDRCWNRWTDVDRWTVVGRWTDVECWSPIYDGRRLLIDCGTLIYDRSTAVVVDLWNHRTVVEGTKWLSCWLDRQCRLDLRPGP